MGRRLFSWKLRGIINFFIFKKNKCLIKAYEIHIKHLEMKIVKLNIKRERLHSLYSETVSNINSNNGPMTHNLDMDIDKNLHEISKIRIKQTMNTESIDSIYNQIDYIRSYIASLLNANQIIKP